MFIRTFQAVFHRQNNLRLPKPKCKPSKSNNYVKDDLKIKNCRWLELGLKSRFDLINFDDFDEDDLKTIWTGEIKDRHFECDARVTSVVARRLAKQAGRKGFGNARAVRKEVYV